MSSADPGCLDPQQARGPRTPRAVSGASAFRVAVTRPQEPDERQVDRLSAMLAAAGAAPVRRPVLRAVYHSTDGELVSSLRRLMAPEGMAGHEQGPPVPSPWLFVTSPRAVRPVGDALVRGGYGWSELREQGVRVAAVGRSTAAALERAGAHVDLVPGRYSGGDLLRDFAAAFGASNAPPLHGVRILLPRAREANEELPHGLRAMGASLELVTVYALEPDEEVAATLAQEVCAGEVDVVTLTSGSAVRSLARGLQCIRLPTEEWQSHTKVVVLGPVTASAAEEMGMRINAVAPVATFRSLVETVMGFR